MVTLLKMLAKVFLLLIGIVCLAHLTIGWTATILHPPHPDHPGKCWSDDTNTAYAVGEKFQPKNTCAEYTCENDLSITIVGCGTVAAPPGYHEETDEHKPYPDCCPKIV